MENPNTWNEDTKAVAAAIEVYNNYISCGVFIVSLPALIEERVIRPLRKRIEELENGKE